MIFSNGTEWELWSREWCENCIGDHGHHVDGSNPGCPIILDMFMGNHPSSIAVQGTSVSCSKFERCSCES